MDVRMRLTAEPLSWLKVFVVWMSTRTLLLYCGSPKWISNLFIGAVTHDTQGASTRSVATLVASDLNHQ